MNLTMLKSKIHRACVTQAEPDYVGSITIDAELMRVADILEYEKVHVADVDNGVRLETYVIAGDSGSGIVCLNGAAARCVNVGDKIIIMSYRIVSEEEAATLRPQVVFVDEKNKIVKISNYEKHGQLG